MKKSDKFINGENIDGYANELFDEFDPERQQALQRLLLQEEYRFGLSVSHLEIAQRHIRESTVRINKQKLLINAMEYNNFDTRIANEVLENLLIAQKLFEEFYSYILEMVNGVEV